MKLILEENFDVENVVELNESSGEKTYVIKGTFSTPDTKNRNGRIYASKLWEDNVSKYQTEIANSTINTLMEKEHPPRTAVDPWSAVAQIRKLEMKEGLVYGEAVLLNIKETEVMRQLIDRGIKIGVSSRGVGRMKGEIVEEFNLITYDIVSTPSDYNANLDGFNESMILEGVEIEVNEKGQYVCTPEGCSLVVETEIVEKDIDTEITEEGGVCDGTSKGKGDGSGKGKRERKRDGSGKELDEEDEDKPEPAEIDEEVKDVDGEEVKDIVKETTDTPSKPTCECTKDIDTVIEAFNTIGNKAENDAKFQADTALQEAFNKYFPITEKTTTNTTGTTNTEEKE